MAFWTPPDAARGSQLRSLDHVLDAGELVRAGRPRRAGATGRPAPLESTIADEVAGLCRLRVDPQIASNGVEWLRVQGWERFDWLWHGFSTRRGGATRVYSGGQEQGELNLGFTAADARETVAGNRRLLAEAITGDADTPLAAIRQVHSNIVVRAGCESESLAQTPRADGIVTDQPGLLLAVQTADCIPVLVADRKRRAVGAFHAGWRGTVQRIVEAGVGRMRLEFGSRPEDLVAAVGPGIGQCCYAVGEEVLSQFESQFAYAEELFIGVELTDPVRARYPMMFLTQRALG